jgi:hypothetical protein
VFSALIEGKGKERKIQNKTALTVKVQKLPWSLSSDVCSFFECFFCMRAYLAENTVGSQGNYAGY